MQPEPIAHSNFTVCAAQLAEYQIRKFLSQERKSSIGKFSYAKEISLDVLHC
jgi:hypothetical protein